VRREGVLEKVISNFLEEDKIERSIVTIEIRGKDVDIVLYDLKGAGSRFQ